MKTPGSLELAVLVAVARLADDAHGLAIRRDVSARTRHDYSVGAIYTTLQRLEDKRLIASRSSAPLPVRGGRSRREYRITAAGRRAIQRAQTMTYSMFDGLFAPEPA